MSGNAQASTHPQDSLGRPRRNWGVGDAALGWIAAQLVGVLSFAVVLGLGFALISPQSPGGYLGRAVGQNRSGGEFVDDALPLGWTMLLQVPGWIVMLGVAWIFAGFAGKARPGWSFAGEPLDIVRGVVVGFLLQIPIVGIVVTLQNQVVGETESFRAQGLVDSIDGSFDLIVLILIVAVGAPVVEELFYRGIVQRSLVEHFGPVIGIGLSSLAFGAVHFSFVELLPLTVAGAGFGLLAHRYGRVLPAIIAHMMFNAMVLVILLA